MSANNREDFVLSSVHDPFYNKNDDRIVSSLWMASLISCPLWFVNAPIIHAHSCWFKRDSIVKPLPDCASMELIGQESIEHGPLMSCNRVHLGKFCSIIYIFFFFITIHELLELPDRWRFSGLRISLYVVPRGTNLTSMFVVYEVQRTWSLAASVDACRTSLTYSECFIGLWALCYIDSHVDASEQSSRRWFSSRSNCAGWVFVMPIWAQTTQKKQRIRFKPWSTDMDQNDGQCSTDLDHWWPAATWSIWVQNCEVKKSAKWANIAFYEESPCLPETAYGWSRQSGQSVL